MEKSTWELTYFVGGDYKTMLIEQPDYYSGQDAVDELHRRVSGAHVRDCNKL